MSAIQIPQKWTASELTVSNITTAIGYVEMNGKISYSNMPNDVKKGFKGIAQHNSAGGYRTKLQKTDGTYSTDDIRQGINEFVNGFRFKFPTQMNQFKEWRETNFPQTFEGGNGIDKYIVCRYGQDCHFGDNCRYVHITVNKTDQKNDNKFQSKNKPMDQSVEQLSTVPVKLPKPFDGPISYANIVDRKSREQFPKLSSTTKENKQVTKTSNEKEINQVSENTIENLPENSTEKNLECKIAIAEEDAKIIASSLQVLRLKLLIEKEEKKIALSKKRIENVTNLISGPVHTPEHPTETIESTKDEKVLLIQKPSCVRKLFEENEEEDEEEDEYDEDEEEITEEDVFKRDILKGQSWGSACTTPAGSRLPSRACTPKKNSKNK